MLSFIDAKGDYVEITYSKPMNYEVSAKGLYETWVRAYYPRHGGAPIFSSESICLPIFTEWF